MQYGKIHAEIFDSSLMAEGGWLANYVFICMVTLSDKDGFLRHDPRTLYRKLGLNMDDRVSYNEFMDAIEFLESPDEMSNLPEEGGRRIIAVETLDHVDGNRGWWVVNKIYYRDLGGSIEQRRAKGAERVRNFRQRKNNNLDDATPKCNVTVTPGNAGNAYTDTDTDTDTDKRKNTMVDKSTGFEEFWAQYPKKRAKKNALAIWKRKNLHVIGVDLIQDVLNRIDMDERWKAGYVPDPTTYLNQERWEDELKDTRGKIVQKPSYAQTLADYLAQHGES